MTQQFAFDPSEPVRRYHAWERDFERRQALDRDRLDQPVEAAFRPWSILAALVAAVHGAGQLGGGGGHVAVPILALGRVPATAGSRAGGEDQARWQVR